MKIFIICCLLFIHVNMCIYIRGFRVSIRFWVSVRVSGIRGFGFGDEFPPESVFGADSGFSFGFRFWVHGDSTRSEPDPLASLAVAASTWFLVGIKTDQIRTDITDIIFVFIFLSGFDSNIDNVNHAG